jgi:glycerophosphoryl diester phosphodiesterase
MALENTENAIREALRLGVPMLEIDVRLTQDKKLVLSHDNDLYRTANDNRKISNHTYDDLKGVKHSNGSKLLTLDHALKIIGNCPIMIELKDSGSEHSLLETLDKFPKAQVSIASFKTRQLAILKEMRPELKLYALEQTKPIEIIQASRKLGLTGIGLNFWLLSPVVYWLARRSKLDIYVYTVNRPIFAKFLRLLYPKAHICTDNPHKMLKQLIEN